MISTGRSGRRGAPSGAKRSEFWESARTIGAALLIALVIKTLVFQPFTIPSASEEPNLYEGDYIVVSKWPYGYSHHSILFSPPLFKGRVLFNPAAPRRRHRLQAAAQRPRRLHQAPGRPAGRPHPGRAGRLYINDKALGVTLEKTVERR